MATPLYKRMKDNGISFYCFPSSGEDVSLSNQNPDYKMNFTKFVLLNIPQQDLANNILDFGESFYTPNQSVPSKYSDQLVESLRNYVANHDENIRQAKINANTDFYNISELKTTTEKIFWKWLKKLNVLDLEPAVHKVDWDKNLSDFNNPYEDTVANSDYFRRYLWKEREVVDYAVVGFEPVNQSQTKFTINEFCKLRDGDYVHFFGGANGQFATGSTAAYKISEVSITQTGTELLVDVATTSQYTATSLTCKLKYTKLVQYIGEINAVSKVRTSKTNFTEVTAFIPHQAGKTPTLLFKTTDDSNYSPNLEFPILSADIQPEILGAENLNNPIRTNSSDYPGSFYGQFDTTDKTYTTSNGDKLRLNGDYYGIKLINNVGLSDADYFENLNDFDSRGVDGLNVDFNTKHYLKMSLPNYVSKNFDEFNAMPIGGNPPEDFSFNAILWYYEIDDNKSNIANNLYGISFLNNPANDDDDSDIDNTLITPYKKMVSNGQQDGSSYIFDLKINFEIDNDMITSQFDSTTIHNMFGFELYNNTMSMLGRLQENFTSIVDQFIRINSDLNEMKSLIYSQTDLDYIKNRISNMESILTLYKTNQFVNSDTAEISVDYSTIYPTLKFNVIDLEYKDIENLNTTDIYTYNVINSGNTQSSMVVVVPNYNKKLLNIINNDLNGVDYTLNIVLNNDLKFKQEMDINIYAKDAVFGKKLNINMQYDDGINGIVETPLLVGLNMPIDLSSYNSLTKTKTYNRTHYCSTNVSQYVDTITVTGSTSESTALFTASSNLFNYGEWVYVNNFVFIQSGTTNVVDLTGLYMVTEAKQPYITINLNTKNLILTSVPIISFYKGVKIKILRVTEPDPITGVDTSAIADRYLIEKSFL